jgi:hypothetical protein
MRSGDEVRLARALLGDAGARRAHAAEAGRDPALAAQAEAIERAFRGLELPPPAPAPPGFARRVAARAAAERSPLPGFALSPALARAVAALLVAAGAAGGAGLGLAVLPAGNGAEQESAAGSVAADLFSDEALLDATLFAADDSGEEPGATP